MASSFSSVHQPCPCGKSHDAFAIRKDGGGFCFSCSKNFRSDNQEEDMDEKFTSQVLDWRGINSNSFRKYGVTFKCRADGEPFEVGFPYGNGAYKVRGYSEKRFRSVGDMSNAHLFGMSVFPAGCADSIIVTEGELDAISAHQITGRPAVSIRGASSGLADCRASREYLNSFNRVYLCLDSDTPGQEATQKIATLFDNSKVYHVKLSGYKDANAFLEAGKTEEFKNIVFYARRFVPSEVVSSFSDVKRLLEEEQAKPIVTYPFENIQAMTMGIRRGIVLITAQEGYGKTEIIRAIEAHILRTTDLNIGIIHLEEAGSRSVKGLAGYELGRPVHLPDSNEDSGTILKAYTDLTKRDERVHIINHFDNDDPRSALEIIRWLVAVSGCKVVFLDHITMMVTGLEQEDERRKLDFISTQLEKMTEELDFSLIMVSHINDDGKTRGSRNVGKVANVRIDLSRDLVNPDETERNKTYLTISKNRDAARTGPAGILYFDPETFIVRDFKDTDVFVPG